MAAILGCRHNVLTINSIMAFFNVKGGYHNGIRDVYFVRAVGELPYLNKEIIDLDRKMDIEMSKSRLIYKRISSLPQISNIADSNFYVNLYQDYLENRNAKFRYLKKTDDLEKSISLAFNNIIELFRKYRNNPSSSMIRNFGTKLLFWFDTIMGEIFSNWSEKICIKIVADNVVKEHEYLFYLFLTYVGCDVLLLQNRSDINFESNLLKYSTHFVLGNFGTTVLGEYHHYAPENAMDLDNVSREQTEQTNKVAIPERSNRNIKDKGRVNSDVPKRQDLHTNNNSLYSEKSYEELAKLASSVVLIAVHDSEGEIIGTGSGIMIGKNGYILTNYHVISGGYFYTVRIEDDEEAYATNEVIKYNSTIDLAVIRIRKILNTIPIYQGKNKLVRGQKVVAIGSPLGLFNSVSDGIISGFRNIDGVDMIQFTAPISHGSSGGAVLNMQGQIIGISTAGFDNGQNINLAIGYENIRMFSNGLVD